MSEIETRDVLKQTPQTAVQWAYATAIVVFSVAGPIATAYVAGRFAYAASSRETSAKFVSLAVGILSEKPKPESVDIRGWAMDVLDTYSGIKLSEAARRSLTDSVRLPGNVSVSLSSSPAPTLAGVPTIDIKANGEDGPVKLKPGESYTFTWVSNNAVACERTSPSRPVSIATYGMSAPIGPGTAFFYPAAGRPVTISIVCTNGVTSAIDSVVITE